MSNTDSISLGEFIVETTAKPGKESIAYSGYLIPETGELIVTKPGWFNYETVIESFRSFLTAVPAEDGKMYCMVLDNAPWHKKAIRLIWEDELPEYQDIRDKMTCISMPPYSPDLNPIEQVWRITRREMTHNRYFPSRIDLEKNWMLTILSTENLMRSWQVSVVSSAFEMNRFRDLYNSDIKFVYYNCRLFLSEGILHVLYILGCKFG